MKLNITAVLLLLSALLVGCSQPAEPVAKKTVKAEGTEKPHVAITVAKPTEEERKACRDQWIAAIESVANKTGDKEAQILVEFFKQRHVLIEPYGEQGKVIEAAKEQGAEWFSFVPLMAGDETAGQGWFEAASSPNKGATFSPETGVLIVRSDMFSEDWMGIILLHEIKHAYEVIHDQYNWQDAQVFCRRERDAHEFQNRLIAKLGGKAYEKWAAGEMTEIMRNVFPDGKDIGNILIEMMDYHPELDKIFGPCQSDMERGFRAAGIMVDINFRVIDQHWKGDTREQKAMLMFTIYEPMGNVLPR